MSATVQDRLTAINHALVLAIAATSVDSGRMVYGRDQSDDAVLTVLSKAFADVWWVQLAVERHKMLDALAPTDDELNAHVARAGQSCEWERAHPGKTCLVCDAVGRPTSGRLDG